MKNELDPWEVGLAEQMKGKEFSFDPQAFADFDNLLQADTLGQQAGEQAPADTGAVMTAGGTSLTLPISLLVIGMVCFASWMFWPRVDSSLSPGTDETINTSQTELSANERKPSTFIAPARTRPDELTQNLGVAPTSQMATKAATRVSVKSVDVYESVAAAPTTSEVQSSVTERTISEESVPALRKVTYRVAALPGRALVTRVTSLENKPISLPEVQKLTPEIRKRDRKALFPDVIKN